MTDRTGAIQQHLPQLPNPLCSLRDTPGAKWAFPTEERLWWQSLLEPNNAKKFRRSLDGKCKNLFLITLDTSLLQNGNGGSCNVYCMVEESNLR